MAVEVHRVLRPLTGVDTTGSLSHIPPGAKITIFANHRSDGFIEILWDTHIVRVHEQDLVDDVVLPIN